MKVKCKKTVVMDCSTKDITFIEGKEYPVLNPDGRYLDVLNEKNQRHCIGYRYDSWLHEHFEIKEER
jgi:hypothetical protein